MADRIYDSARFFEKALDNAAEQFGIDVGVTVRKSLVDLASNVIRDTPRETGRAAAAWNVSAEHPDESVPPEGQSSYDVPEPKDPGKAANYTWYLTNNIEYIEPLENGHSSARPNGMLAVNLVAYGNILRKYANQTETLE